MKSRHPFPDNSKVAGNRRHLATVYATSPRHTLGQLCFGERRYPCALGRRGLGVRKREGDGKTPVGAWGVRCVLYRADRVQPPQTPLDVIATEPDMGWCDAPDHNKYNQLVTFPFDASAETLWREDHLYDLVLVLGFNDRPVIRGHGSAIFMHLAKTDFSPTEGCVALRENDLRQVLRHCSRSSTISIKPV